MDWQIHPLLVTKVFHHRKLQKSIKKKNPRKNLIKQTHQLSQEKIEVISSASTLGNLNDYAWRRGKISSTKYKLQSYLPQTEAGSSAGTQVEARQTKTGQSAGKKTQTGGMLNPPANRDKQQDTHGSGTSLTPDTLNLPSASRGMRSEEISPSIHRVWSIPAKSTPSFSVEKIRKEHRTHEWILSTRSASLTIYVECQSHEKASRLRWKASMSWSRVQATRPKCL